MIDASAFIRAATVHGYDWYSGVPCSYLTRLVNEAIAHEGIDHLPAANEGDAIAAAVGATIGGRRAIVYMQNSGLGNAVNPITSLVHTYRVPVLMIISLRGDAKKKDEPQHELMGRITTTMLDAMEVPWRNFPREEDDIEPALSWAHDVMSQERRACALVLRHGALGPGKSTDLPCAPARICSSRTIHEANPSTRRDALLRVLRHTGDEAAVPTVVVATTGHTGRELYALADRANHLYMVGSMGCASSLGLGLALARPDVRVVVVDGDGAALMRLGNLATVGSHAGSNLVHVVLSNGRHQTTGGQPTTAPGVCFAGIAESCGYESVHEGSDLGLLDEILTSSRENGPAFGALRIAPGSTPNLPRPTITPEAVAQRLASHIRSVSCCC